MDTIIVRVAIEEDSKYSQEIVDEMASSAKARGTDIAKRTPEYVSTKMKEGKGIIAVTTEGQWVGFCYIESWGHEKFVSNSGLIVNPDFRGRGVAKAIKFRSFALTRKKFPNAKIFGLTTGLQVMKINNELGYLPVPFSELTDDEQFWKGCASCVNFPILTAKNKKNCLCTGMLYDPEWEKERGPKDWAALSEKAKFAEKNVIVEF